jgi:hypothetical protein
VEKLFGIRRSLVSLAYAFGGYRRSQGVAGVHPTRVGVSPGGAATFVPGGP